VLVCASEKLASPASDVELDAGDAGAGDASLACASTAIVPVLSSCAEVALELGRACRLDGEAVGALGVAGFVGGVVVDRVGASFEWSPGALIVTLVPVL